MKRESTNKSFFPNRKKITETGKSGVYLLFDGDEVVYVGQGLFAEQRVETHIGTDKKFDSYYIIYCKKREMNQIEAEYICEYTPKYNHRITCVNTNIITLGETYETGHKTLTLPATIINGNLYINLSGTGISLIKRENTNTKTQWVKIKETKEKTVWLDVLRSTKSRKFTKTERHCLNPNW